MQLSDSDLVLGIESSCDETAAAVVRGGREILSNIVASQEEMHAHFGGIVPEVASRRHAELITVVVESALREASVGWRDLALLAVTQGPGLVGSLLVGVSAAKGWTRPPASWASATLAVRRSSARRLMATRRPWTSRALTRRTALSSVSPV